MLWSLSLFFSQQSPSFLLRDATPLTTGRLTKGRQGILITGANREDPLAGGATELEGLHPGLPQGHEKKWNTGDKLRTSKREEVLLDPLDSVRPELRLDSQLWGQPTKSRPSDRGSCRLHCFSALKPKCHFLQEKCICPACFCINCHVTFPLLAQKHTFTGNVNLSIRYTQQGRKKLSAKPEMDAVLNHTTSSYISPTCLVDLRLYQFLYYNLAFGVFFSDICNCAMRAGISFCLFLVVSLRA